MTRRPTLASLTDRLNPKPGASVTPVYAVYAEPPEPEPVPKPNGATLPHKSGRPIESARGVLIRVSPELWEALKILAVKDRSSLQSLMIEAAQDLLKKKG